MLPIDAAKSLQVESERGTRTYRRRPDGSMDVPEHDARIMRAEGMAVPAGIAGPTAHLRGFDCVHCGRRNYFRRCGSCGETS
jgi:hypothetical protein